MTMDQLMELFHARARRRFSRGLKRKPLALVNKLRKAKKEAPPNEKPEIVKTHLRNMIIVPEMVGSIVGVYNGKTFNQLEGKESKRRSLDVQPLLVQERRALRCETCVKSTAGAKEQGHGQEAPTPTASLFDVLIS
ncbi:uncharacterized protein LOC126416991 [Schistocerca serialis cubense]|uniref:uncharacterized protein LOC126416991 n=1 Tax=Schistocerca serialis cubense TaxID=2023355 RepID=UPI00214EBD98|nr:uncharacterized protein LOC126416991 [Schistocerca serialis cubense]